MQTGVCLKNLPARPCFYSFINTYLPTVLTTMPDAVTEETARLPALAWLLDRPCISPRGGSGHLHTQL